jgi:hypothetical protein
MRLTGGRGPAHLPGQSRCALRGPTMVESVRPRHEWTFYDGPRTENPSQPRFALLAYTALKRQRHGASPLWPNPSAAEPHMPLFQPGPEDKVAAA